MSRSLKEQCRIAWDGLDHCRPDENKRPDPAMGDVGEATATYGPSKEDVWNAGDAG